MSNFRSDLEAWQNFWDQTKEELKPTIPARVVVAPDPDSKHLAIQDLMEMTREVTSKSANPIMPDSIGMDQEQPKPVWVSEDLLKEVEALKNKLFKIENSVARLGQGENWSEKAVPMEFGNLPDELKVVRQQIDRISSQLGIKDEPSCRISK